jgi:capsular exopolysaccharide synthesis family protein
MLIFSIYNNDKPDVDSTVLIGIYQKSQDLEFSEYLNNTSILSLINRNTFLKNIIDSLGLRLTIPHFYRSHIIQKATIKNDSNIGVYSFNIISNKSHQFSITKKDFHGFHKKIIFTGYLSHSKRINFSDLTITFTDTFYKNPFDFDFSIVSEYEAIDQLKKNISLKNTKENEHLKQGMFELILTGKDPVLNSETINLVSKKLIDENFEFIRKQTLQTITALEKQLRVATEQLNINENNIKVFKSKNPEIAVNSNIQDLVAELPTLDLNIYEASKKLREANLLYKQLNSSTRDILAQDIIEALYFLEKNGITNASGLQSYYKYLLEQKFTLENNEYAPGYKLVKENNEKIDKINTETQSLLLKFINNIKKEISTISSDKRSYEEHIKKLPEKEMYYASLLRQQFINSEIYSEILNRYNRFKLIENAIVSDLEILDYSGPAQPEQNVKKIIALFTLGVILSFLISLAPPMVYGHIEKKLHTEEDLRRFFSYRLLEEIPAPALGTKGQMLQLYPKLSDTSDTLFKNDSYIYQVYLKIYSKINLLLESDSITSLLITCYSKGNGSLILASNLAYIASRKHSRVLLIDSDIRHGMLHNHLGYLRSPGLSDILSNEFTSTENIFYDNIKSTNYNGLDFLSAGSKVENPSNLFLSQQMKEMFNKLKNKYEFIIVSSPPLSAVSDAYCISREVQSCIIVLYPGDTDVVKINKLIDSYPFFKEKLLGIVLIDSKENTTESRKQFCKYIKQKHSDTEILTALNRKCQTSKTDYKLSKSNS